MSEITTINAPAPRTIDNVSILTNGDLYNRLQNLAKVMANSGEMVPAHYRGKPDACMATVMQAARWGMDPFAVAQKTHIISGTLGYEAQLVNAVITTMAPTKDRIHYDWFGPWENVIGKFQEKTSSKGNKYIAPAWSLADENGVGVKCGPLSKARAIRACSSSICRRRRCAIQRYGPVIHASSWRIWP